MRIKVEKEFQNFIFNIKIEDKDFKHLEHHLFFINQSYKLTIKLIEQVEELESYLKDPINYNQKYRIYKENIKEKINSVKQPFNKIHGYYINNYIFNKYKIRNDYELINELENYSNNLVLSEKNEINNLVQIQKIIKIFSNILDNYSEEVKSFIKQFKKSKNDSFIYKLSQKKIENILTLETNDYISYKENNLEVNPWVRNQLSKKAEELFDQSRKVLNKNIDFKNALDNNLNMIYNNENFLKEMKEKNELFILLKNSSILKSYLFRKNSFLKLKINNQQTTGIQAIKQFLDNKSQFYKVEKRNEDNMTYELSKSQKNIVFCSASNKKSLNEDSFYKLFNKQSNNYIKKITNDSYYTIVKLDNHPIILRVSEYKINY